MRNFRKNKRENMGLKEEVEDDIKNLTNQLTQATREILSNSPGYQAIAGRLEYAKKVKEELDKPEDDA